MNQGRRTMERGEKNVLQNQAKELLPKTMIHLFQLIIQKLKTIVKASNKKVKDLIKMAYIKTQTIITKEILQGQTIENKIKNHNYGNFN